MPTRSGCEFGSLTGTIREIYEPVDVELFAPHVLRAVARVVPSDWVALNEVNPQRGRISGYLEPATHEMAELEPIFAAHVDEHPLVSYYRQTLDGRAHKISDFMPRRRFRQTGMYGELYRAMGVEYQISITLPATPPLIVAAVFSRRLRDYGERDRSVLDFLRPHLSQAYLNAEARSVLRDRLESVDGAMAALGDGLVVLGPALDVVWQTDCARRLVEAYFPDSTGRRGGLPGALAQFVGLPEAARVNWAWLGESVRGRLRGRVILRKRQHHLILEEVTDGNAEDLAGPLGLTRREAEVLLWVCRGKTNPQIAQILGNKPRTVQKQLEAVFAKLGVETRAAAAVVAAESLRQMPR